jgi:hypothetical protein
MPSVNDTAYRRLKSNPSAKDMNGGVIIDHEAPRERRFVAVEK